MHRMYRRFKDAWPEVVQRAKNQGYQITTTIETSRSRIYVTCPNKHTYAVQAQTWVGGSRCGECANAKKGQHLKLTESQVRDRLEAAGYMLVGNYTCYDGTMQAMENKSGRILRTTMHRFSNGHRLK